MANFDLSGYSLTELKGLQHNVEKELKIRQHQDLQKAREEILAIAQEAGISLKELLASDQKARKKEKEQKIQARYQNPDDNKQTWAGRGRQPKWLAVGLAGGKSLEDFHIQS